MGLGRILMMCLFFGPWVIRRMMRWQQYGGYGGPRGGGPGRGGGPHGGWDGGHGWGGGPRGGGPGRGGGPRGPRGVDYV